MAAQNRLERSRSLATSTLMLMASLVGCASEPDFHLRMNLCLEQEWIDETVSGVKEQMPKADVRAHCTGTDQVFGIWTSPPRNAAESSARDEGMARVPERGDGETFSIRMSAGGIRKYVDQQFSQIVKTLSPATFANSKVPIFFDDLTLSLSPGILALSRPSVGVVLAGHVGDRVRIGFKAILRDYLWLEDGKIHCENYSGVDIDTTLIDVVLGASYLIAPHFTPGFIDLRRLITKFETEAPSSIPASQRCSLGRALPDQVMIPGGRKIDFSYFRLSVDPRQGLAGGGFWELRDREPSVAIFGPSSVLTDGDTAAGRFSFETKDLREPLTVSWTQPKDTVVPLTGSMAEVSWATPELGISKRGVTVHIIDADMLEALTSKVVWVKRTLTGDVPSCDSKPYLPGCNPEP